MSVVELPSAQEPVAPSRQSLLALSWLNFFLSAMQTAFGPIAAAYLAAQEWTAKDIGFALSIGGIASLISQVPGGELIDAARAKRLLVAICVIIVASSTLVFRLWPASQLLPSRKCCRGSPAASLDLRSLLSPSDSLATPDSRNGLDRTSALRPPAASRLH
jgi:hypothetical protein